jgi:hypothetical protein
VDMLRALFLCVIVGLGLGGCVTDKDPARFDAFTHNKMAVLARNIESARDAHVLAGEQIVEAVRKIKAEASTGARPQEAYDLTRRQLARCESRRHSADRRLKLARNSANEHFSQWGRELEDYDDKTLREASRRSLNDYKARFRVVAEQMDQAGNEMERVVAAIQDQMLFVKHHRNTAALPPRPQPEVDLEALAEPMMNQIGLVVLRADEFVDRTRAAR